VGVEGKKREWGKEERGDWGMEVRGRGKTERGRGKDKEGGGKINMMEGEGGEKRA